MVEKLSLANCPLVSIYIPTHNRSELLCRAVESVLSQSYENIEVCISDDGSRDGTEEYCQSLLKLDSRIKYCRSDAPMGACAARNRAIEVASGEYITGLDDDDQFHPHRIKSLLSHWDPRYAFVCDNFLNVDSASAKRHYRVGGVFTLKHLMLNNEAGNQVFTLTSRMRNVGGFSVGLKKLQDWDCWLRLCKHYGSFLRLNLKTYSMHHEHEGPRVSSGYAYTDALEQLLQRNASIFDKDSRYLMQKYLVQNSRKGWVKDFFCSNSMLARHFILRRVLSDGCFKRNRI